MENIYPSHITNTEFVNSFLVKMQELSALNRKNIENISSLLFHTLKRGGHIFIVSDAAAEAVVRCFFSGKSVLPKQIPLVLGSQSSANKIAPTKNDAIVMVAFDGADHALVCEAMRWQAQNIPLVAITTADVAKRDVPLIADHVDFAVTITPFTFEFSDSAVLLMWRSIVVDTYRKINIHKLSI